MQGNKEHLLSYAAVSEPVGDSTTPRQRGGLLRFALIAFVILALALVPLGIDWSQQPDRFDVQAIALEGVDGVVYSIS